MNAVIAPDPHQGRPIPSSSIAAINAVQITGDMLVDALAHAFGTNGTQRTSLTRFAAQQRLKPPAVAVEALTIRMALLGALMDSCGIVEGEWFAACEAVARIRLDDNGGVGASSDLRGITYDAAHLQEMIWAYSSRR